MGSHAWCFITTGGKSGPRQRTDTHHLIWLGFATRKTAVAIVLFCKKRKKIKEKNKINLTTCPQINFRQLKKRRKKKVARWISRRQQLISTLKRKKNNNKNCGRPNNSTIKVRRPGPGIIRRVMSHRVVCFFFNTLWSAGTVGGHVFCSMLMTTTQGTKGIKGGGGGVVCTILPSP